MSTLNSFEKHNLSIILTKCCPDTILKKLIQNIYLKMSPYFQPMFSA